MHHLRMLSAVRTSARLSERSALSPLLRESKPVHAGRESIDAAVNIQLHTRPSHLSNTSRTSQGKAADRDHLVRADGAPNAVSMVPSSHPPRQTRFTVTHRPPPRAPEIVNSVKAESLPSGAGSIQQAMEDGFDAAAFVSPLPGASSSGTRRNTMTKRVSSTEQAAGGKKYNAWLKKSSSVRKALGNVMADSLALTGSKRMEGNVTSFSMISQGIAQQKRVVAALKREACFARTSVVHLSMICTVARARHHTRYGVVYREGAAAHTFYVLKKGAVQVTSQDDKVGEVIRVEEGGELVCFGTEGLTGGMPRVRTVTCLENSEMLHFGTFRTRLSDSGAEELAQRAFSFFVEQELQKMPLFFGLKAHSFSDVASMFELREVATAGTSLYSHDTPADTLYILAKGHIQLESDGVPIAKLQAGTVDGGYPFFGESSLLESGGVRTESAITRTPVRLLVLPKRHFARLTTLMPFLKERVGEFHKLRVSSAEQARLAAADEKARISVELKAKALNADAHAVADARAAQDDALDEATLAATSIQRQWRGTQVRTYNSEGAAQS